MSRQPLVIAPCVSYAAVNERYAPGLPRHILESGCFGCGVPFINDAVLGSFALRRQHVAAHHVAKQVNSGFLHRGGRPGADPDGPAALYECEVIGTEHLGTHVMIFGKVTRIRVGADVPRTTRSSGARGPT